MKKILTMLSLSCLILTTLPIGVIADEMRSTQNTGTVDSTVVTTDTIQAITESTVQATVSSVNSSNQVIDSQTIDEQQEEVSLDTSTNVELEEVPQEEANTEMKRAIPTSNVQMLIDALNAEDLVNAVGSDGTGVVSGDDGDEVLAKARTSYPNVNNYIAQQGFKNPTIVKDSRFNTLPKLAYKQNRPIGIVVHETANDKSGIVSEVNYMYSNWMNAFVHAFVDNVKVVETAPTEFLGWGAGKYANPYFIHIELVREQTFYNFAKSVNNDAYWIALQLYQWGLTPSLADNNRGEGTVISHNAVSRYFGGTTHVDPYTYFAKWGYDINQFYSLIQKKYNAIKASDKNNLKIKSRKPLKKAMQVINPTYYLYTNPYKTPGATKIKPLSSVAKNGDFVDVVEEVYTSDGKRIFGLANGLFVDARALKEKITITTEVPINKTMRVLSSSYSLFDLPESLEESKKIKPINDVHKKNVQIRLTSKAETSDYQSFYRLSNGYYVNAKALAELATIKKNETYSNTKNMRVASTSYNLYSQPYNTLGMSTVKHMSKQYNIGDNAIVSKYVETNQGINNYFVDSIGWVDYRALENYATFKEDASFKAKNMRVKKTAYNIYSAPYLTVGMKKLGHMTDKYKVGSDVRVTRTGVNSLGNKVSYIDKVGWVSTNSLENYATFKEDTSFKAKNMRVKKTAYNIYSAPYLTVGMKKLGHMTDEYKVGSDVRVTRTGVNSLGNKVSYINKVGWVSTNSLENYATFKADTSFKAKNMRVKKTAYNIYSAPYLTVGMKKLGHMTDKYKVGSTVKVTRTGVTTFGNRVSYIDKVGWISANAVK